MIVQIIDATVLVLTIAIIARSLLSYVITDRSNPLMEFLITVTEPILKPIRSVLPRMGMFDFSPLVAIILMRVLASIITSNIQG